MRKTIVRSLTRKNRYVYNEKKAQFRYLIKISKIIKFD